MSYYGDKNKSIRTIDALYERMDVLSNYRREVNITRLDNDLARKYNTTVRWIEMADEIHHRYPEITRYMDKNRTTISVAYSIMKMIDRQEESNSDFYRR